MTPELEQLHVEFQSVFGKEVSSNKKNDAEWIKKKIAEANETSDQNQADPVENQAENTEQENTPQQELETEPEPELQSQDEEEYSSEEDTQLSYEAKKITKIKYPL